jgi:hypothetical protein
LELFSSEKNFFDNEEIGAGRTNDVALQLIFRKEALRKSRGNNSRASGAFTL